MASYVAPLQLVVAWHSASIEAPATAERIHAHFGRSVSKGESRGLGIPTYFRSAVVGNGMPASIDLDQTEQSIVIPLIDAPMVNDPAWTTYLKRLFQSIHESAGRHLMLPVAMDRTAFNIDPTVASLNFVRRYEFGSDPVSTQLLLWLTHEVGRHLQRDTPSRTEKATKAPIPLKLFISHAKQDGADLAKQIRDGILQTPVQKFFDTVDIAPGYAFANEIEGHLQESTLLIVQTDLYATRAWCRREVLIAKKLQRPVIVLCGLKAGESRSFPYMGNVPTLLWTGDNLSELIKLALTETLRSQHIRKYFKSLARVDRLPKQSLHLSRSPELSDCGYVVSQKEQWSRKKLLVIYPDPPLGSEERETLAELTKGVVFATPSMNLTDHSLKKKTIGLSISMSPDADRRGLGKAHFDAASTEIARHLLAADASIAYGGDLRRDGFTRVLFELVRAHNSADERPFERIRNYLSWPAYLALDPLQEAELRQVVVPIRVPPPEDLDGEPGFDKARSLEATTPIHRYVVARCLTEMRERMNDDTHARILLGGRVDGYSGKYPGIAEEAYLALRAKQPVYLLGGFGGCAKVVADVIQGRSSEFLTQTFQARSADYSEMQKEYNQRAASPSRNSAIEPIHYSKLVEFFKQKGLGGLRNGLSDQENQVLFESADLDHLIYLILKGLFRVLGKKGR